jgi:hypothetical protein
MGWQLKIHSTTHKVISFIVRQLRWFAGRPRSDVTLVSSMAHQNLASGQLQQTIFGLGLDMLHSHLAQVPEVDETGSHKVKKELLIASSLKVFVHT